MTSAAAAAGSFASDGRRRNRETRPAGSTSPRRRYARPAHRGVVRRPLTAGGPFAFLPRRRGGNVDDDDDAAVAADTTLRTAPRYGLPGPLASRIRRGRPSGGSPYV